MVATALRVVAAAGLGVDAYVHADLATAYGGVQGGLFLLETGAALAAALGVLALDRRWIRLGATAVAAAGLVAVVLFRYVDVGTLGPVPDLYEPVWYPEKAISAVAEAAALTAGLALLRVRARV